MQNGSPGNADRQERRKAGRQISRQTDSLSRTDSPRFKLECRQAGREADRQTKTSK
jgi:hypothetical protein